MNVIIKTLNFLASVRFNLKAFSWETAKKLPVKIAYDVKVDYIRKDCIRIEGDIHRSMIQIGISELNGVTAPRKTHIRFGKEDTAKVIFKGAANFAKGALLAADRGTLIFGDNFYANNNFYVSCNDRIEFGDHVLIGWEVKVRDSDNHTIIHNGKAKENHSAVKIGNHVWIASFCDILKGAGIPDDCVVAYRALVTKDIHGEHCIIAGAPAKVIEDNIDWKI